jgi:hypothetical protein
VALFTQKEGFGHSFGSAFHPNTRVGSDRTVSTLRQTLQDRNFSPESSVKDGWSGRLP